MEYMYIQKSTEPYCIYAQKSRGLSSAASHEQCVYNYGVRPHARCIDGRVSYLIGALVGGKTLPQPSLAPTLFLLID